MWMLGWAYWSQDDMPNVLKSWYALNREDPDHTGLQHWLPIARRLKYLPPRTEHPALGAMMGGNKPGGSRVRLRLVDGLPPTDKGVAALATIQHLTRDSDASFLHLTGPVCPPTAPAEALRGAGFSWVSIANNLAPTATPACQQHTARTLDHAKIPWSGPSGTVTTVERRGIKLALLAFGPSPSGDSLVDPQEVARRIALADRSHDIVVVSLYGGADTPSTSPPPLQTEQGKNSDVDPHAYAKAMVHAGADLIVSHEDVGLRGMGVVEGRLVTYNLGSHAPSHEPKGRTAVVLEVELSHEGAFLRGRLFPVPSDDAISTARALSLENFPGLSPVIEPNGTMWPQGVPH